MLLVEDGTTVGAAVLRQVEAGRVRLWLEVADVSDVPQNILANKEIIKLRMVGLIN